jgi:hypothetical protein
LLNLLLLVQPDDSVRCQHLAVSDRSGDILRVQPVIKANAFSELLNETIRTFPEYA